MQVNSPLTLSPGWRLSAVAIEQADPGERCGTCGQAAGVRVTIARMDGAAPAVLAYCRADMSAGIAALAARRRRRESLN